MGSYFKIISSFYIQLHGISSGLKAFTAETSVAGIEVSLSLSFGTIILFIMRYKALKN